MSTLVVGDGNFSFSRALLHACKVSPPSGLTATSYDSREALLGKYGLQAAKNVEELEKSGCRVMCNVDGTNLAASFPHKRTFDTIIFQHPLIDANDRRVKAHAGEMGAKEDYIIANRLLVLDFLLSAERLLNHPDGEIKVTVKEVHPYTLWRVARLEAYAAPLLLKRQEKFKNEEYPGYETMNVETNNAFPSESAATYVFGFRESRHGQEKLDKFAISQLPRGKGAICEKMRGYLRLECSECNKFFTSEADRLRHTASRKHEVIASLEDKWTRTMQAKFSGRAGSQVAAAAPAADAPAADARDAGVQVAALPAGT